MNATINKQKMMVAGSMILLVISLSISGLYFGKHRTAVTGLNSEKLRNELILSEKLLLDKEIVGLKAQLQGLKGTNAELDKVLAETGRKLSEKEAELKKIKRENGNVKSLKAQLADVTRLKNELEGQIAAINGNINKLNSENDKLNKTIAELTARNEELSQNLNILSSLTADNFMVESTKGKGKLTVKAKRTNKIAVTFKVPPSVSENLTFKITKPDGSVVAENDKAITMNIVENDEYLFASIQDDEIKVSKKIEMVYQPKKKLKPGVYQIGIYNGDQYVGSTNVRLR